VPLTKQQIPAIIHAHKTFSVEERRRFDKWASWYNSEYWPTEPEQPTGADEFVEGDLTVETNYPYAFLDTMVAGVVPANPQVTVNAKKENLVDAAEAREALINYVLRAINAKELLWKQATHAGIYGRGIMKVVYSFKSKMPDFHIIDPRQFWFDLSAGRWRDIRYAIHVTVLTQADFQARVKRPGRGNENAQYVKSVAEKAAPGKYPEWLKDSMRTEVMQVDAAREAFQWITVYEFYDFTSGRYYHYLDNCDDPLFAGEMPYRRVENNFRMLTFNDSLRNIGGLSDIQLIEPSLERLNEIDTLELWHAQSTIPEGHIHKALLDNPEDFLSAKEEGAQPGRLVPVDASPEQPLTNIIEYTPSPQLNPSFRAMRERLVENIEYILGLPKFARGGTGASDVATELALADQSTKTRNGRRQAKVYDVVEWMAECIIGLYEEYLSPDDTVPVRLTDLRQPLDITRSIIGAGVMREQVGETPLEYDYDAIPFSPTENHRLVQLKSMQSWMEYLVQSPSFDQAKVDRKLAKLLELEETLQDPTTQQLAMQARMGAPIAPQPAAGGDTVAGGMEMTEPVAGMPVTPLGGPGNTAPTPGLGQPVSGVQL